MCEFLVSHPRTPCHEKSLLPKHTYIIKDKWGTKNAIKRVLVSEDGFYKVAGIKTSIPGA
jgi:hypothetical protein